ncbi:helix-turn-helix domain-containing protein [Mycobacterium riyadhense]|uniref:helix-turn-helix domain-containing protein n=1 Tax=Mycobacterium riyadhense TaxID=486698 RepID=UPI00195B9040
MEPALGCGQTGHLAASDLLAAFAEVGFTPSLSKVAALWSGKPTTVRLDDLDKICAALDCTVADLLEAEPLAVSEDHERRAGRAVGSADHPVRPSPRRGRAADRCRRTDRWHPGGRGGRSGNAQFAWAGVKNGNTPPAPPARNGGEHSRSASPVCGVGTAITSTATDSAAPACRSCASTIRAGSSPAPRVGRCSWR